MISEFDYNEEEFDENVFVKPISYSQPQSLHSSRARQDVDHRQALVDLDIFISQSKNKENKKIQELKQRQNHIGEGLMKQEANKQMKKKQIEEDLKQQQFKECTFQPKLKNNRNGPKRTFNEFLENQNAHSQRVQEKRQNLRKKLEENKEKATYRPKINSSSNSREGKESIFNRLYSLKDKQAFQIEDPTNFHPIINERSKNMRRNGPVEQLLYDDALRRQERGTEVLLTASSMNSKIQKPINLNNEKFVAQKFIKQYFLALSSLQIDTSLKNTIDYVLFNELLKKLGFITNDDQNESQVSSTERTLIHNAYQLLIKTQVNARNVCVFLMGILGIYHVDPVNFIEDEISDENMEFNLDEVEGRRLQQHFNLFYRNRLSSEPERRVQQKVEPNSYQPKINKQSTELAEKHRNFMLEETNRLIEQFPQHEFSIPENGMISHHELLVLHRTVKELELNRKRSEREDHELKQCTFKPNTISSSLNNSKISQLGSNKCIQLYQYHKSLMFKKDSSAPNQQIDSQCTFQPQINQYRPLKQPIVPPSKQTDETLYRMHKGRQQHQKRRHFLERGQKQRKQKKSEANEQNTPTLVLDVNFGQKVNCLCLYPGDENRLTEVAHQFALKHSLDQQNEEKLVEMLKLEMEGILSKIEEDEESEDCDH